MNRGEWQDLFNWAWWDVWPNHLGQPLDVNSIASHPEQANRLTEALAVVAEFYEKRRDEGNDHENAKHRVFEDIMQLAGRVPAPTATTSAIVGQFRLVNNTFADDTGPRCLSMLHAGNLFLEYVKDRDTARAVMDLAVRMGYHGLRVWTRLRGEWWKANSGEIGHEITFGWERFLRDFITDCRARGLVLHLAAGDLAWLKGGQRADYHRMMAGICHDYATTIALYEWANEARDTTGGLGPDIAERDVQVIRDAFPGLVALTAYTGHEDTAEFKRWTPPWQRHLQVHALRDGRWWDKIRHPFSLVYEGGVRRLAWHGEPWGVGPRVSASSPSSQAELTRGVYGLAAWQVAITGGVWTDFFSPGVILGKERFEDFPQFGIAPKMAAVAERFGRQHGISWGQLRLMHGGAGRKNVLTIDAGGEHARIDQAIDDAKGICFATVYGPEAISARLNVPGQWTWTWVNPDTAEVTENVTVTRSMKPGGLIGVRS